MLNTPEAMAFLEAVDALEHKHNLSETVGPDYYEPGMMENLAQYLGQFNAETGCGKLRVDVKGLRYENRSQRLERLAVGDSVTIARDQDNPYNPNNFEVLDPWGDSLGTLPAGLCNAMAPIYDSEILHVRAASVSYMERLCERSRYAKQGVLFIEIVFEIHKQIETPNPN